MTRRHLPDLIVLDIMLPDMDGYQICKRLRTTTRTSHIPIIFLTQKGRAQRQDRRPGAGRRRLHHQALRHRGAKATRAHGHPRPPAAEHDRPNLRPPSGRLIEEQLRELMRRDDWRFLLVGIDHLDLFNDAYGFRGRQ
jgi:CheY-like chemotaxis protein